MTTLIVLGVLFGIFVLTTILTEVEHFGWATVALIATLVAVQFFHVVDILAFAKDNVGTTIVYVGMYVAFGVGWSFMKWFSYLRNLRDKFRSLKEQFFEYKKLPNQVSIPQEMVKSFTEFLSSERHYDIDANLQNLMNLKRPRARDNKSRIVAWMCYWPFSFVGTLLNDPIRRLFTWIWKAFSSLYQRMADHVFREDLELK